MNTLFHSPAGGDAQRVQVGQVLELTSPTVVEGLTVFRRTLYLRIPLDAACDRLSLAAASALGLRFEPCTVRVESSDGDWVKRWAGIGGQVQVELAYPAPLTRVDSDLYGKVALHRVDGAAVSAEATLTATTGAVLPEPFTGVAFEARLSGEKPTVRAGRKSATVARKQADHRSLSAASVGAQLAVVADHAVQEIELLVELLGGLTALHLAATPGSPRLTLRSANGVEVLWQWVEPGTHAGAVDYAAADLAADWQPALDRALALVDQNIGQTGEARPAVLVLPLEVASDAPCRVQVMEAGITALLERPLLPAPVMLRFSGASAERQSLELASQPGAQLVTLIGHLGGDAAAAAGAPGAPPPHGVHLAAGDSVHMTVAVQAPLRCTALAVGWIPLAGRTALNVRLEAPTDATRALATADVESESAAPGPLYARWPTLDVQAGSYGVRITGREGSGVLAATPADNTSITVVTPTESHQVSLQPHVGLLDAGESSFPAGLSLNGDSFAVTADQKLRFHAGVANPPAVATWTLSALCSVPLTLTIESARVSYTPN